MWSWIDAEDVVGLCKESDGMVPEWVSRETVRCFQIETQNVGCSQQQSRFLIEGASLSMRIEVLEIHLGDIAQR